MDGFYTLEQKKLPDLHSLQNKPSFPNLNLRIDRPSPKMLKFKINHLGKGQVTTPKIDEKVEI
jgi:hypothetical protein